MQGTARLLAAIAVLLFSPQLSGEAQTLSAQVIVHACEKGEPPFKGEKFGNVSKDVFDRTKGFLAGDATDIDHQIERSLCVVALWEASQNRGLNQNQRTEAVPTQAHDKDAKISSGDNASSDKAIQDQILALKKGLDQKRQTQSTVYGTCLVISVIAVILAGFAVLYSRSATRRALRTAGLL
jgi:hypothetical protein